MLHKIKNYVNNIFKSYITNSSSLHPPLNSMNFFKITDATEIDDDITYHSGHNIDPLTSSDSCVPSDIEFTTKDHISKFYNCGI